LASVTHAAAAEEDNAKARDVVADEIAPEPLGVIQVRKYQLLHEASLLLGGMPTDPYYKGLTASLGYTWHVDEDIGVQVLQFTYALNLDTNLKKALIRTAQASNGNADLTFPEIEWIADVGHVVFKPIYGKEALFNRSVIHLEADLQAGPSFVRRNSKNNSFCLGVDAGFGFRFWVEEWLSVRFDMSELVYWVGGSPTTAMRLTAGLGFNLRGDD